MKGFRLFLMRGNVTDLAVAVVIGAAFGSVVSAFVRDLLTPLIAAIGGKPDFSALSFTINGSRFAYGDFINSIISFLLISVIIYYLVVLPMNTLMGRMKHEPPSGKRICPECLSQVPLEARRCAFCTSQLTPITVLKTGA